MTDKLAIAILTGIRESTDRLAAEQGYPEGSKLTVECFDAAIKALRNQITTDEAYDQGVKDGMELVQ